MIVEPLKLKTHLAIIENSVEAKLFRDVYALVDGEEKNITNGGEYSCAFFVSTIALMAKLIKEIHVTVSSTVRDLKASGWVETTTPQPGDIVHWEPRLEPDGTPHEHLGFYWGVAEAISNSTEVGSPQKHHLTYGETAGVPNRLIVAYYSHPSLR